MDGFSEQIAQGYRVVRERIGDAPQDWDITIPLRGDRGFAYVYGKGWAGIWLNSRRPTHSLNTLVREFPDLVRQQVGDGECTFRVPMADLDRLLVTLGAKTVMQLTDEQKEKRAEHSKVYRHEKAASDVGDNAPESTIAA